MLDHDIQVFLSADGQGLASHVDHAAANRISISIPTERDGSLVPLEEGTEIEITWTQGVERETQHARGRVLGPSSVLPNSALDVELLGGDDSQQRRDNVRIPVWIGLQIWPLVGPDEIEPPPMIGTVFDLSGGGISARVPSKLEEGSRLLVRFDLTEDEPLETEVCVRRHIMADRYGLSFENMGPRDRERVIRHVFSLMREQLRRRAGGEA